MFSLGSRFWKAPLESNSVESSPSAILIQISADAPIIWVRRSDIRGLGTKSGCWNTRYAPTTKMFFPDRQPFLIPSLDLQIIHLNPHLFRLDQAIILSFKRLFRLWRSTYIRNLIRCMQIHLVYTFPNLLARNKLIDFLGRCSSSMCESLQTCWTLRLTVDGATGWWAWDLILRLSITCTQGCDQHQLGSGGLHYTVKRYVCCHSERGLQYLEKRFPEWIYCIICHLPYYRSIN